MAEESLDTAEAYHNYRNRVRPPLLFISGGDDHLMPPVVQHSNAAHYTAETLT